MVDFNSISWLATPIHWDADFVKKLFAIILLRIIPITVILCIAVILEFISKALVLTI